MSECEWCGSSKHLSDRCPTRELVRGLTGEPYNPELLPEVLLIGSIDELEKMVGIAHTLQHDHKNISKEKKPFPRDEDLEEGVTNGD